MFKKASYRGEQDDEALGKEEEGLAGFFGSKLLSSEDWSSLGTVLQPWPPAPWVFLVRSSS